VLEITKMVPSFTSTRQTSPSGIRLNIRGVGATTQTSVEPSVATFLDDVYVAWPGSVFAKFFDLANIEVLRGPQGTLFGRNASVGALSSKTQKPTDAFEGYVEGQVASFDSHEVTGAINVAVSEKLATRAASIYANSGPPLVLAGHEFLLWRNQDLRRALERTLQAD
jgi:iron complex outermembrane receptor protein